MAVNLKGLCGTIAVSSSYVADKITGVKLNRTAIEINAAHLMVQHKILSLSSSHPQF